MNKKTVLLIVVLCGIAAYYLLTRQPQSSQSIPPTPTPVATTPPSPSQTSSATTNHALVNPFEGEKGGFGMPSSTIVNPSTGARISLRILNDSAHQNKGGSSFGVFINQERIGEADGDPSMFSFSADNKLLAFRSRWNLGCAGTCHQFWIYVINLEDHTITNIGAPRKVQTPMYLLNHTNGTEMR